MRLSDDTTATNLRKGDKRKMKLVQTNATWEYDWFIDENTKMVEVLKIENEKGDIKNGTEIRPKELHL